VFKTGFLEIRLESTPYDSDMACPQMSGLANVSHSGKVGKVQVRFNLMRLSTRRITRSPTRVPV